MAPRWRGRRRHEADLEQVDPKDELEQLFNEMEGHMALDRILDARTALDKIEAMTRQTPALKTNISDKRQREIQRIRVDSKLIQDMLHDLQSDEGWKLSNEHKGVTVKSKHVDGSPIHAVKTHTILENFTTTDFVHLVSLFVESDLMPLWFPQNVLDSVTLLAQPSKYRQIFQSVLKFRKLPISDRDIVCEGIGYHLSDQNAILVFTKSIDHSDYCEIPPVKRGRVRMEVRTIFFLEMLPGDEVRFCEISHDNPKLRFVPAFVLNWLAEGSVSYDFIQSFKKVIRNYEGSPWEERVNGKQDYYRDIEERVVAETAAVNQRAKKEIMKSRVASKTRKSSMREKRSMLAPSKSIVIDKRSPGMPLWKAIVVTCIAVAISRMSLDRAQLPWFVYGVLLSGLAALLTHWTFLFQKSTKRKKL